MNSRFLQAVLRSLGDIGPPVGDDELLRQFVGSRSEAAFGELVRRHGRLVWAVCRHLTGSEHDADDAFQATLLVLVQNARKIRDAAKLSSWLHGVATKVCAKSRQARQRRTARDRASAAPLGNGAVVPDSAWDRALAAVHEEAATLMVTCGLGLGVGAGWLTTAQGQAPQRDPKKVDPQSEIKRLQDQLDILRLQAERADRQARDAELAARGQQDKLRADLDAALAAAAGQKKSETYTAKTTKWEYDFVAVSDMGTTKFVEFLQDRENRGWEYNGQTTLRHDGKTTGVWMFRRPPQRASAQRYDQILSDYWRHLGMAQNVPPAKPEDATAIEAEIGRLQARLQTLTKTGKTEFTRDSLPLEPGEFAEVLKKMVQKRFPGRTVTITSMASGIVLQGDLEVRRWVSGMVNKLVEQEPERSRP